jgi:hypothetical protein
MLRCVGATGGEVMDSEKNRESRLRKRAIRMGLGIKKSRSMISLDNHGGFMVIDLNRKLILAGQRFDLSLDDVEAYLKGQVG